MASACRDAKFSVSRAMWRGDSLCFIPCICCAFLLVRRKILRLYLDSQCIVGCVCFIGDYELGGEWKLTHVGYDYLILRVSPLSDNADDISMVKSIYTNSMLTLEYITADRMYVESPLSFTRQTVVLHRVSGEPDSTKP